MEYAGSPYTIGISANGEIQLLHGTDVFISAEIKNNGVTIDYAYGCDNKKTDVTVDTNILYKKTHETYSVSTDIIGSTRWAFDSI